MKKMLFDVLTVDSESEDEVEVLSENITNYGNVAVPLEITPQIRDKIISSLGECANFTGKIGEMKVYASKNNNNSVGTVRATMVPSSGQAAQIINLGPASTFFHSQVKDRSINNSRKRRSPYPIATGSKKVISEKRFLHSLADGPQESRTLTPIIPPSHIRSKHREQSINTNPSVETSRIHANDDPFMVSSPSTVESSHDSTPDWFNDLSQSVDNDNGLNESSSSTRIMTKVEKNPCFNSLQTLTPQATASFSPQAGAAASSHHQTGAAASSSSRAGTAASFHQAGAAASSLHQAGATTLYSPPAGASSSSRAGATASSLHQAGASASSFHQAGAATSSLHQAGATTSYSPRAGAAASSRAKATASPQIGAATSSFRPTRGENLPNTRKAKKATSLMKGSGGSGGDASLDLKDDDCTICFEEMHESDSIYLKSCWHRFHQECINLWMESPGEGTSRSSYPGEGTSSSTCPICRMDIVEDGKPYKLVTKKKR